MKNLKKLLTLGAALAFLSASAAQAGGYYPTLPAAGSTSPPTGAPTYPLTGNEDSAYDTNLPSGANPQTVTITTRQLTAYANGGNQNAASIVANTSTSAATPSVANLSGAALVVLQMNGTMTGDSTITTPTGAQFLAAIPNAQVGDGWQLKICNNSSANHTWTLTAGASGVTIVGTATIAQNACRTFVASWSNVTSAVNLNFTNIGAGNN